MVYGNRVDDVKSARYLIVKNNHGKFAMTDPVKVSQSQSNKGWSDFNFVRYYELTRVNT